MGWVSRILGISDTDPKLIGGMLVPEITSESEDGFVDFVFFLADQTLRADGSHEFLARGKHHEQDLAVKLILSANWTIGFLGEDQSIPVASGVVIYESIGKESENHKVCHQLGSKLGFTNADLR